MPVIKTYTEFVTQVKALGCKVLIKEVNTYGNDMTLPVLYAEVNNKLVGTWSPKQLGRVIKVSANWSKKNRQFTKVAI